MPKIPAAMRPRSFALPPGSSYMDVLSQIECLAQKSATGQIIFLGRAMIIAAYHKCKDHRHKIICPGSAHGTNPFSAIIARFEVVNI